MEALEERGKNCDKRGLPRSITFVQERNCTNRTWWPQELLAQRQRVGQQIWRMLWWRKFCQWQVIGDLQVNLKMKYEVDGSKEKYKEIFMRILRERGRGQCGDSSFQVHLCYNYYFSCFYCSMSSMEVFRVERRELESHNSDICCSETNICCS